MDCIIENKLYLGDWTSAEGAVKNAVERLSERYNDKACNHPNITHILTICADKFSAIGPVEHTTPPVKHLQIFADDVSEQDLLYGGSLQHGVAFICSALDEDAESNNAVLVHCLAGISRSSTFVIAYLMHSQHLSYADARKYVAAKRLFISPNMGFVQQLLAYEMLLGHSIEHIIDISSEASATHTYFTCKSCRTPLFTTQNLRTHLRKANIERLVKQNKIAKYVNESKSAIELAACASKIESVMSKPTLISAADAVVCTHGYFLRAAMTWMAEQVRQNMPGVVKGKLLCPQCACKLGQFDWAGGQCQAVQCRTQIVPWLHIQDTKVDVKKARTADEWTALCATLTDTDNE